MGGFARLDLLLHVNGADRALSIVQVPHGRGCRSERKLTLKWILPWYGNPGTNSFAHGRGIGFRRNCHGHVEAFGEDVRRLRGKDGAFDGVDALHARLFQLGGVLGVDAACLQLRVAHVEIPHAVPHVIARAVNVAVVEAAFLEPLLEFGGRDVLDRVFQPGEQLVFGQREVLLDAVQAVQLELQLLAFGGRQ